MTKVIVIGEKPKKAEKKPIEFLYYWNSSNKVMKTPDVTPSDYNFVELICLNYFDGYDLIFAYSNPEKRGKGVLYLGKFNDGVAE